MSLAQKGMVFLLRIYQFIFSPLLLAAFGPSGCCRFTPSCSQYALESVQVHGAVRGGFLAARRLCRCHPWGKSGEDPVPPAEHGNGQGRLKMWKTGHCHGS